MSVLAVNKDTRDKIRVKAGIDEYSIKDAVKILKDWLDTQPHLPHDYDGVRMETLFFRCKASIEKCKHTIDMYYTLRSAMPEIFCNRDPYETWFKDITSIGRCVTLPELTDDYDRVTIIGYVKEHTSQYNVYDLLKLIFMCCELRTVEDYNLSEIFIIDCDNLTAGDAVKFTFPVLKRAEVVALQGYKGRIKALHFINAPLIVDSIVDLFRRILKPKLAARVHVHRKGYDNLLKIVPHRILPEEYGGGAGSMLDHWDKWKTSLESYRDWFIEQENYKVDESKRPDKSFNTSDLFGFEGTFRQLNVD